MRAVRSPRACLLSRLRLYGPVLSRSACKRERRDDEREQSDRAGESPAYSNFSGNGYRELVEGETITFDVTQSQKGPQAENIARG
ncbi:cold shock domain-containing protein [Streptomyces sp. NPDC005890]|uniref:cold shock domain-containing protein n=1 Tax=Streptomyces sp. NPDC005890 TaxID=3154568 RepID=UPI0033EFFF36